MSLYLVIVNSQPAKPPGVEDRRLRPISEEQSGQRGSNPARSDD